MCRMNDKVHVRGVTGFWPIVVRLATLLSVCVSLAAGGAALAADLATEQSDPSLQQAAQDVQVPADADPVNTMSAMEAAQKPAVVSEVPDTSAQGEQDESRKQKMQIRLLPLEEIFVTGRLPGTDALARERIDDDAVANFLGSESISRTGDSNVASALRRVPGLTLVGGKFVYVRGLGERYSSTTLNGARVPSPDLTRSILPLDIFPASIVDSLRVQKSYSADLAAAFGGGNVDIRTKAFPDGFVFGVELGSAGNTENDGTALTYNGGGTDYLGTDDDTRALSGALQSALLRYQGDISASNILHTLREQGQTDASYEDARAENRRLALLLNRDISLQRQDTPADVDTQIYLGNSYLLFNDTLEIGFLAAGVYESNWRDTKQIRRNIGEPEEQTDTEEKSTYSVDLTGSATLGLSWAQEHDLLITGIFLRNTDDETSVRTFFNANRQISDRQGFQNFRFQFEEREVQVGQLNGAHYLGANTKGFFTRHLPFLSSLVERLPDETQLDWHYSESRAITKIPNQVEVQAEGNADVAGVIRASSVRLRSSAADFRFTDLDGKVWNSGVTLSAPFYFDDVWLQVSIGGAHTERLRVYEQLQFNLGPAAVADTELLAAPLGEVFADERITDAHNDFIFTRTGANNESYIAHTETRAGFVKLDGTFLDQWRLALGVRHEQYTQLGLSFNPVGSSGSAVLTHSRDEIDRLMFTQSDLYPSLAFTYSGDWLAQTFQFRAGYSETVTRPDLREITAASYVDPLTGDIVSGNLGVVPSAVKNYDLRWEWFFSDGDKFAISAFYKDIADPIELFEVAASDSSVAREIINTESARTYGVELELDKNLADFLGDWGEPLTLRGNLTLQDSQLQVGDRADAPTNAERALNGASPWVINLQLDFDSTNGAHAATLAYNASAARLFVAGRNGAPDGFEQPIHSLDATYKFYYDDHFIIKGKVRNILGETRQVRRGGVNSFEQRLGTTYSLGLQWDM